MATTVQAKAPKKATSAVKKPSNPARTATPAVKPAKKATPAVKPAKVEEVNTQRGNVWAYDEHKQDNCPGCGIHLSNGIGEHNQEVNGKAIKHKAFRFECLGCGHEFGPAIRKGNTGNKGVHLTPEGVKGKDAAIAAAKAKGRKRPVLAVLPDGSEVLCCSRTARKNGWKLVERLFSRKTGPAAPAKKGNRAKRLDNLKDILG